MNGVVRVLPHLFEVLAHTRLSGSFSRSNSATIRNRSEKITQLKTVIAAHGVRVTLVVPFQEISVQYFGPDSLEATLALVRLRIACPQVTTVTFPRANFMRSIPPTAERHHISAGDTCFMGVAEQKLAEELRPRLICNCALCLLHDDSDSNLDHFHRNVHELWSLLTAAEQSAYETIAGGD